MAYLDVGVVLEVEGEVVGVGEVPAADVDGLRVVQIEVGVEVGVDCAEEGEVGHFGVVFDREIEK